MNFSKLICIALALIGLVSAGSFLLRVQKDEAGKPYVEYEGEIFYLSNSTNGKYTGFVKNECFVKMDLSLEPNTTYRDGNMFCKSEFEFMDDERWKEYVEEQMTKVNSHTLTEDPDEDD